MQLEKKKKKMNLLIINPRKDLFGGFLHYLDHRNLKHEIQVTTLSPSRYFMKNKIFSKNEAIIPIVYNFFYFIFHLVTTKARKYEFIILNGVFVVFPFLLISKIFPVIKPKEKFIVIYFYVHSGGKSNVVQNILHFFFNDEKICLLVQNTYEINYYSQIAEKAEVIYFPYCQGKISTYGNYGQGKNYIFAGGYTNRDYECLLKAAKKVNYNFLIICSKLNRVKTKLHNVKILNDVDASEFFGYLRNSKIVILPLKEETGSSGQMVALAAMFFKKPIIYTNITSVSQYFEDGVSGLSYETGDEEALIGKISCLLSDPNLGEKLGMQAYKSYSEHFYVSKYYEFLVNLIFS